MKKHNDIENADIITIFEMVEILSQQVEQKHKEEEEQEDNDATDCIEDSIVLYAKTRILNSLESNDKLSIQELKRLKLLAELALIIDRTR